MEAHEAMKKVVETIFNNWTALELAVEHSMGGPLSKQVALETLHNLISYCVDYENVDKEDIEDYLTEIMDRDFNTICEDNSIPEIASLLFKFMCHIKNGDNAQFELDYNKLPAQKSWLTHKLVPKTVNKSSEWEIQHVGQETCSTSNMIIEEDSEWTQVRSRRKK